MAVGQGVGSYAVLHMAVDFMVKAGFVTSPEHVEVGGERNANTINNNNKKPI